MDFTREPIIETIITPKEGYQLVIRSSKAAGQEEYFVDAVEIVAFGSALFFRSMERPKAFLVPVSDYEILEVREARMALKNAGFNRSIKIGGGREAALKSSREMEREEPPVEERIQEEEILQEVETPALAEARSEPRVEKKRDRRRHYRKRRGREEKDENEKGESSEPLIPSLEDDTIKIPFDEKENIQEESAPLSPTLLSSLLQPPSTLISETIKSYRQNESFKNAFFLTEEEQYKPHDKVQELLNEDDEEIVPPLLEPTFASEEAPTKENVEEAVTEEVAADQETEDFNQEDLSSFIYKNAMDDEVIDLFLPFLEEENSRVSKKRSLLEEEQESEQPD